MSSESRPGNSGGVGVFNTTRWSLVLAAGEADSPEQRQALEQLCSLYWRPLYGWLRRSDSRLSPEDVQDQIQGFFEDLIERIALAKVDPSKGKFRSFLLASLKNYGMNQRARVQAQKRGGAFQFVSWEDAELADTMASAESLALSPDKAYERTWALALLAQVLTRLGQEQAAEGKGFQFETLQVYLTGDKGVVPYAESASRLGMGESAVKMAIQRLRRRFGEILREEVAETVSRAEEIDEEIRALFAAVTP